MRFDLTDLRLFLAVAEAGSITAGAERANMALASASERIQAMEAQAGTALLERLHRGVVATPAGRALIHHARDILDAHDRMRGDLAQYGRGLKGHVRMLANTSAISEHLPGPLAGFLATHPQVDLDLEEALSRDIVEAVAAGRVDLGVASDQVDVGGLTIRDFRRDDLVLVAPRGHPLGERKRVSFAETLEFEHVGLGRGGALQSYLGAEARKLGRPIAFRVRVGGFDAVCRMVEHGVGVGITPIAAARRARRTMAIRIVPLSDAWAARRLVIATRPDGELSQHAKLLVDWLLADAASA